jgi:hypothetical protein
VEKVVDKGVGNAVSRCARRVDELWMTKLGLFEDPGQNGGIGGASCGLRKFVAVSNGGRGMN